MNTYFLPPAARGPHGMGDLLGPSGLLKASLNEQYRQQLHQNVDSYIMHYNSLANRVSKPSTFLSSQLLSFHPSTLHRLIPLKHPQKLLIR